MTTISGAMSTTAVSIADGDLAGMVESALLMLLPQGVHGSPGPLDRALHYGVFPGGKRLRPLLTMFGARIFGQQDERVLRAACAVEFVHASSLIIDDLPCMDDAQRRRGNPALHCVYGEDLALLTALALLNQAYALFGETTELIREAAECIGLNGIIGGQAIDLCPDIETVSLAERDRKTSALMRLALTAGALTMGASHDEVAPLAAAGQLMGQAYQICDDLLDAGVPGHSSGKTIGQDIRHGRPSHASELDATARSVEVPRLIEKARCCLLDAFGPSKGVIGLIGFIDNIFEYLGVAVSGSAATG